MVLLICFLINYYSISGIFVFRKRFDLMYKVEKILSSIFLISQLTLLLSGCNNRHLALEKGREMPAWKVIQRVVPQLADRVLLKIDAAMSGHTCQLEVKDGILAVTAGDQVALCRGVYDYLKNDLNCLLIWEGLQGKIPEALEDVPLREISSPVRFRHYLNQCTAGYTMAFWDWDRWEKEIDWMAMHGINMPLSMNGQELIWKKVWQKMGLSEEVIASHFPGPAYLPWFRMGNLKHWQGPLPEAFIEKDAQLQKNILARERELGMTPIMPAFSGFVPDKLADFYPNANFIQTSGWLGFEPLIMLDPADMMYQKITKTFLEEYQKEYGALSGYYLVDPYNEMTPPVSLDSAETQLEALSKSIYKSLQASDPHAVWVLQGWMFHYELSEFWNEKRVGAFLSGADDDKMIVLDLGTELEEVWKKYKAVGERMFIWNHLHNFGQHTNLFGQLDFIAEAPIRALDQAGSDHLIGMGLTMEGTLQNEIVYELMLDRMWLREAIDVEDWLDQYVRSRYQTDNREVREVWKTIKELYYSTSKEDSATYYYASYQKRPSKQTVASLRTLTPSAQKYKIIQKMLNLPDNVISHELFYKDLVDLSKDFFQEHIGVLISDINQAIDRKEYAKANRLVKIFNDFLKDLDVLLSTIASYQLENWLNQARNTVSNPSDKALLEGNARTLVTFWGGDEILNDYARKEWSGLVDGYYGKRWNLYFAERLKAGFSEAKFAQQLKAWEHAWSKATEEMIATPPDEPLAFLRQMLLNVKNYYQNNNKVNFSH